MSGAFGLINLHYIVKIPSTESPIICHFFPKNT